MMDRERDEELRELLALAAVGALDREEQVRVEAAIADRPDLQAELAELEATAAAMATATAEEPPAHLRGDVLAAIADVPQLAPRHPARLAGSPADMEVDELAPRRRRRWLPAVAAAAVVALLAGTVAVIVVEDGDGGIDTASVVEDESAVVIPLDGAVMSLRLVHAPDVNAFALLGDGVPMPTGDDVYELWMIEDEQPHPVEVFRPRSDGAVEVVMADMAMPAGASFAVTIEPAGGSDQPTGAVVAASS
jgi:anti-sigma-K factor RskA